MMAVMQSNRSTLQTQTTPLGILNLRFAYNSFKAGAVLNSWSNTGTINNIKVAKTNTCLNFIFIFIFFYTPFLYFACLKVSMLSSSFLSAAGKFIAKGVITAAVLDVFENTGMLFTLNGYISDSITLLTVICSVVKMDTGFIIDTIYFDSTSH